LHLRKLSTEASEKNLAHPSDVTHCIRLFVVASPNAYQLSLSSASKATSSFGSRSECTLLACCLQWMRLGQGANQPRTTWKKRPSRDNVSLSLHPSRLTIMLISRGA
jgi:hypothetical protein